MKNVLVKMLCVMVAIILLASVSMPAFAIAPDDSADPNSMSNATEVKTCKMVITFDQNLTNSSTYKTGYATVYFKGSGFSTKKTSIPYIAHDGEVLCAAYIMTYVPINTTEQQSHTCSLVGWLGVDVDITAGQSVRSITTDASMRFTITRNGTGCSFKMTGTYLTEKFLLSASINDGRGMFKPLVFTDASKLLYHVSKAKELGIVAGTTATTFSPNKPCTRAEIVTMLYAAAGHPAVSGTMSFEDVKQGKWYYNAVLWAYKNNVTAGTSESTFSPNKVCTRSEIVTMVWAWAGKPYDGIGGDTYGVPGEYTWNVSQYKDVKSSDWFYKAVIWATRKTPIFFAETGITTKEFTPKFPCTRELAAYFVVSAYEYKQNGH